MVTVHLELTSEEATTLDNMLYELAGARAWAQEHDAGAWWATWGNDEKALYLELTEQLKG